MKKIFTLISIAAIAMSAFADEYTGQLAVMINGFGASQETTITITKQERAADATDEDPDLYTLLIKNFSLDINGNPMPVGNIELNNLPAYPFKDKNLIVANQIITIAEGDDPNVTFWLGPKLGEIPVSMVTKFDDATAAVDIVIDLRDVMEQLIYVNFDNNTAPEPKPEGKRGDLNGDDKVNVGDVGELYKIILNPEQEPAE